MRRLLVVLTLVLAVVAPATALAQGDPFSPLPPAAPSTPAPTPTPTAFADQGDVSRGLLLGIAGGVAVIFVGIGWFITRDARAHLTEDDRRALDRPRTEEERRRGKVVKSKARAKGKRQRQARKAHRRR